MVLMSVLHIVVHSLATQALQASVEFAIDSISVLKSVPSSAFEQVL